MLRKSEPYALLLIQLLLRLVTWSLVTWSLVNDSASFREIRFTSFDTWRVLLNEECLPSLEVVNWRLQLLTISFGEVWGLHVKVMPSFSAACLDLPSIPLIVRHCLVLSVLWSMLSANSFHCLLLRSDVVWWSHHSVSTAGARRDPACVGRLASPSWLRSTLGLVACKAYVFQ